MADPGFLQMWVIDADVNSFFRIDVAGNGGSGKTLILKRFFRSQMVRLFFGDGFLLWLTVLQSPSFTIFKDKFCSQIVMQTKINLVQNMKKEDAKMWLNQRIHAKMFALFLDDVWGEGGKLLQELGVALLTTDLSNSKIIVSSRDRRALLEMGVSESSTITMGDLVPEKSWDLFVHHSFPYNNGNLPANIDERRVKGCVCQMWRASSCNKISREVNGRHY